MLIEIIERLQFAKYPTGAVVFEQGDEVNKDFFIIITGSVEVWVKDKNKNQTQTRLRSIQLLPSSRTLDNFTKSIQQLANQDGNKSQKAIDATSMHDIIEDNLSHSSAKSHVDVDLDVLKQQDCLKSRGELVPELPKQTSKLIRKKSDILGSNLSPNYVPSKPQLVKNDSFLVYPTPKTEAERKSIRNILLSDTETDQAKKLGFKYAPQTLTDEVINLNSPSLQKKQKELNTIVGKPN